MSFTVEATASNGFDSLCLKVYVVTNGAEGGSHTNDGNFTTPTFSLTPTDSNSVIVEGVYDAQDTPPALTPNTNNVTDDSGYGTASHPGGYWFGHWDGAVTATTPITTLGGSDDDAWNAWAAYEVIPSGGTPAIDASTPAAAIGVSDTGASSTTAAFTPPAGSVLVAILLSDNSADPGFAMSDTSGLGLTWTQRGTTYISFGFVGSSAIFTTTLPAGETSTGTAAVTLKKMKVSAASAGHSVGVGNLKLRKMVVAGSSAGHSVGVGNAKLRKMKVVGVGKDLGFGAVSLQRFQAGIIASANSAGAGALTLPKLHVHATQVRPPSDSALFIFSQI
jgi:hypothetical protein